MIRQEVARKEPVPGVVDRPCMDPGWRGDPLHRRHIHARDRQAHPHRPDSGT
ncbi:MAG: hypothetical protein MZV63_46195 [Marinilabiliales bacterium]|nr:hypothetical protein [Marinilabiliales bacterium]